MGPAGAGGVRVGSPGVLMTLLLKEVTTYLQQLVLSSREPPPPANPRVCYKPAMYETSGENI